MITRCRVAKGQVEGLSKLITYLPENFEMAEIGSYSGESTVIFAQKAKFISAIDPWENNYDRTDKSSSIFPMSVVENSFDERTRMFTNIKKVKLASVQAAELFESKSLDFVYVDGLHTYSGVKQDILSWLPKIKKKGLIGGHDYTRRPARFKQVIRAVNELLGVPALLFEDTSWLIKL